MSRLYWLNAIDFHVSPAFVNKSNFWWETEWERTHPWQSFANSSEAEVHLLLILPIFYHVWIGIFIGSLNEGMLKTVVHNKLYLKEIVELAIRLIKTSIMDNDDMDGLTSFARKNQRHVRLWLCIFLKYSFYHKWLNWIR